MNAADETQPQAWKQQGSSGTAANVEDGESGMTGVGRQNDVRATESIVGDVGTRTCLVIGESGADWSAGIATARRFGPNLALVTQWVGEAPRHFSQRVIARLSKRRSFASIIMVCNQRNDASATEARQEIVRATGGAMSDRGDREITLICSPTGGGGIPPWAPLLAEHLPRHDQPLGLTVELGAM